MPGLPRDLQEKITAAHTVGDLPPSSRLAPWSSIRALLDDRADRFDQDPFLIFHSDDGARREYSYAEFAEAVARAADYLRSLGVAPGDRVATVAVNHDATVIQYMAAWMVRAVLVPVNPAEDDRRVSFILRNARVRVALVRDTYVDRILALRPSLPDLLTVVQTGRRTSPDLPHFETDIRFRSTTLPPDIVPLPSDEALIVYTSGTTGNPKGVVLTQDNLLVDAMAIAEWHILGPDQRLMCVLPIHHVNGIVVTLLTPLWAGGSVVLNQRFHVEKFFERMSAERVHVVSVVPTILQFLLHARPDLSGFMLGHVRHIICGAGPLTVDLAQKFEAHFSIPIIHGYGLSETTCYSCFLPLDLTPGEHEHWMSGHGFPSIGNPLPVNEMAIHDAAGREVPDGERGEIVIRGQNVMAGYFDNEEANAAAFTHGWFRSGDEGFCREDDLGRRFFFITGRIKELIIRGGVNISPFEIDEVLMGMPGVAAGIAVGFDNDWYGEEVGAYVRRAQGSVVTEEEVLAWCRRHLPFHSSPKVVVFGEDLPVTSTGKYQRNRCREHFASWRGVQFTDHPTSHSRQRPPGS
jgi:long-chain acyl-CoA synthetase